MMNVVKTLALISTLFAAQSAMAGTYDFGLMGPPDSKTITASSDSIFVADTDTFTFSVNANANVDGSAPNVPLAISYFKLTGVAVWSVVLLDSTNTQIGATDYTTDNFSFANLSAGAYSLVVKTSGNTNYSVTLTTAPAASAVPEPEAYAMMLAGLGLVGFAARRKLSA